MGIITQKTHKLRFSVHQIYPSVIVKQLEEEMNKEEEDIYMSSWSLYSYCTRE